MRAAAATLRVAHAPAVRLRLTAQARRRAVVLAALALLLAVGYVAWFRDSTFVHVDHVTVTGLSTPGAGRLRAELTAAAGRMTTLDVDEGALRAAVGHDPLVRSIAATGEFPSTLRIDVVLNLPVAELRAGGRTLAVSGDGTLLPGVRAGSLPTVAVKALPHGRTVGEPRTLQLVSIAASAPSPLRPRVDAVVAAAGKGFVAQLRGGPAIVFGDARRLAAKWAVAAAVLAHGSSSGAAYVDVHFPEQPIAGGLTLANGPLTAAQPDPSDPAGPGVIAASSTTVQPQAQALQAAPVPQPSPVYTPPATSTKTRP
jgi:hypothetical protein